MMNGAINAGLLCDKAHMLFDPGRTVASQLENARVIRSKRTVVRVVPAVLVLIQQTIQALEYTTPWRGSVLG
jgi:hypothetical protein